ncbi:carbohydrate sulfotransferase 5-like [Venturia canescens]|uniref:carbohydrate sulfotransferase 5-like n=1 Tax=Venturia canescens TaxID=32260 RepID=UPI001C9D5DF4|nr:carbohydrate sulfotransferase 5-like [Venturia canescens]XP_043289780.1 carbohydrate sulfotransferase 5-like [Venturia canescens]XP_043289781.1 carbohydrate sulfotransferase 5-like [Venturia canescens]XP_043289782.1 carbohydrate sulfotransferase 5-like [Venturia canescens]XP_043289784.1 carbohydrate sulfotransferase 5-like [Venturia canescens]XP_043289785.1 carbohydrate sulfotransferase 5-like [Venturia canescens]XP_043289786.1 carbohydrate sulfotransferase 5-like [Venturia canescens]
MRIHVNRTKMSKRLSLYGLVGLTSLCIFFLAFSQRYSGYLEHRLQPVISEVQVRPQIIKIPDPVTELARNENLLSLNDITNLEINRVLDLQRRSIEREMYTYDYPNGKYGVNVSSLDDLVMERGGRPMRSVILTSWRSGSTFLGDVINAHPASFYHYEPLLHFGIVQVREPELANEALENIYALFKCDYDKLQNYLDYGRNGRPWVFNHNTRLWQQCQNHKEICWDSRFVSKFCRLFPFQSMKLVRLRLKVAQIFLEEESLGVRMVLLIRDPRGLLQSRKHRGWCPSNPDCSDPSLVCNDMVSDFMVSVQLAKKYPQTFRVVRYEDLSVDPFTYARSLYKFYGLDLHPNVQKYLETHTKNDVGGLWSTYRNSKTAPFHWRNDLDYEEVEEIQSVCSHAMKLWGYVLAMNATHQRDFDPITNYSLDL